MGVLPQGYSTRAHLAGEFWKATVDTCEKGGVYVGVLHSILSVTP